MRLGAVFPHGQFPTVDPDAVVRLVQRLEDAGYDHLLVYDHVLGADTTNRPGWTGYYTSADPFLEPLVLFAYLARSCSLELVTDVMVLPQRQTALVAKQVASLALLAPGRIRLGVGIGWNDVEYQALGIDFRRRAARMEEQIPLLRRLWSEASVDHVGETEVIDAAGLAPRPPTPVPIWIGCGTDSRAVARVGRLADGWLPEPTVQPGRGLEPALVELRAAASAAGRDPDALGLEGQVWSPPDQADRLPVRLARWRDAGADAVGINSGRAGEPWSEEHLDALLRAADARPS
jgi:probable F420-dependent oxidoreductase